MKLTRETTIAGRGIPAGSRLLKTSNVDVDVKVAVVSEPTWDVKVERQSRLRAARDGGGGAAP
eukprot:4565019-Heterocapsa_arctica.AAC.1